MDQRKDQLYMQEALKEAELALNSGEFPVGCVFVLSDQIVDFSKNLFLDYLVEIFEQIFLTSQSGIKGSTVIWWGIFSHHSQNWRAFIFGWQTDIDISNSNLSS